MLVIKTNASHGSVVLIKDVGIEIPASGGSVQLTNLDSIILASKSRFLRSLATDDVYGAGSSTLIVNDGAVDVDQDDLDEYLAGAYLPYSGKYGVPIPATAPTDEQVLEWDDTAGRWVPVTNVAGADEKAKVSSNDTTSGYLNGKLVGGNGVTLTEVDDGNDETLSIAVLGAEFDFYRLTAPSAVSNDAASSWKAAATCMYDYSAFDSLSKQWRGYVEMGSAGMDIRIVRSDGVAVSSTVNAAASGIYAVTINVNLPSTDDAFIVQFRRTGGGTGGRVVAGAFEFGF